MKEKQIETMLEVKTELERADNIKRSEMQMPNNNLMSLLVEVGAELERAEKIHPAHVQGSAASPTTTPHGGYAVILEELEEFWEQAKLFNLPKNRDTRPSMRKELIQVAAMALRTIRDCELPNYEEND